MEAIGSGSHSNGSDYVINSGYKPLKVVVDDRELDCSVVDVLRQIDGITIQSSRLSVGDYIVDERCVFERKTLRDFAASIKDGRLFTQASRLAAISEQTVLVLEGRAKDLADSEMRREAFQGALITLMLVYRLPVLRSLDAVETAHLMIYAARQLRGQSKGISLFRQRRSKNKRRSQLRVLQSLPGIGPERAIALLDYCRSVQAVMMADQDRLEGIPGIGNKTAAGIRWVLD